MKLSGWLLSAAIAVLSLLSVACGRQKVYKIGVSQCSSDDWRNKMNEEMRRAALCDASFEVEIRSADDSNEKQIADVRYFADNGFDLIIVAPNEAHAITPIVKEVYERGIPVIVMDRDIEGQTYTANIHADNEGIGRQAADYAVSMYGRGGSLPKVLEITGLSGSTPAKGRRDGFDKEYTRSGGEILAVADAAWNQTDAERVTDSLLDLYPETGLIYAHNDRMAIGAAGVARRKGRDDISILGIDAAPEIGIKAVSDSLIDATFLYPTEGYRVIQTAMNILRGEPYEREIVFPASSAVDRTNADILLMQNASLNQETATIRDLKNSIDDYWHLHSIQTNLFYAVLVIMLLALGMVFVLVRAAWARRRHQAILEKKNRELEEYSREQKNLNEELNRAIQSKMAFFTNVSHDLRTPLTLISEPVHQLAVANNLTPAQHTMAALADKNVRILERLISEILDFRKIENGNLRLNVQNVDLGRLVAEWTESFSVLARSRDIKLTHEEQEGIEVKIDVEKMERVFYNLVSNAIKYSRDNGSVAVSCRKQGDEAVISVTDTGIGISEEDQKKIFDNFFQVEKVRPRGSGIGLSLAKAFVELHGGQIEVSSSEGKGSTFTIRLPLAPAASSGAETKTDARKAAAKNSTHDVKVEFQRVIPVVETLQGGEDRPGILVIDDNPDMLAMIAQIAGSEYDVHCAGNGKEGLAKAIKMVPDLIICDVMMPEMNGYEFCRMVKEEISTSHVPVLLLTACSLDEQRAEGYESGADGYLSKPFSTEVFIARCRSLIANRKRIKRLWQSDTVSSKSVDPQKQRPLNSAAVVGDTDPDNAFYARFVEIFNERMSDSDLNIETIASEMGLGHSQFYRKIKSLTNYTPVELMRRLRLQKARDLLLKTDLSVSEIAYQVGFSAPAYFTKCFRAVFEESPSELRERFRDSR